MNPNKIELTNDVIDAINGEFSYQTVSFISKIEKEVTRA